MTDDFYERAATIRDKYKRLITTAQYITDKRKLGVLQAAARTEQFKMKMLLAANGYDATQDKINEYLK